jgi:hypothetical protein
MNIGLIAPNPGDATSFYRAFGVWPYLCREHGIRIVSGAYWGWEHLTQCDALVLQRPFMREHGNIVKSAYDMKIPVWVDYDDNLFDVPLSNPTYPLYANHEAQAIMRAIIGMANVVSVSTEPLAKMIRNATVIPNAINDYIWSPPDQSKPANKVVSWRGSSSHFEDMEPFVGAMKSVSDDYPDWVFHFIGHPHWGINQLQPERRFHHLYDTNLMAYMNKLKSILPAVHVVTLVDNGFNRAKSNVAWEESTYAGAAVVAPDFEEWRRPGVATYTDTSTFETALRNAIVNESDRARCVSESLAYIDTNLRLSQVNKMRLEVLRRLCPGKI